MGKKSREKRGKVEDYPSNHQNTKLEIICFKIVEWGTYLALFTPLIVNSNFYYPFVVPKAIFFRILVDVILVAYLLLVYANSKYKPRMNWLSWSIVGFLAVSIISAVTGENFTRSFWGTFERMTGVLTLAHLVGLFIVVANVFRERKYWERIMTICIIVGIILTFLVFLSNNPSTRGGGTLGNTSFMSAYIIFDIFFAIILFFIRKGWWRIFYGIALIITTFLLLFPPREPTQGAIGAFFGGIVLLLFLYFLCHSLLTKNNKLRNVALISVLFLVIGGIALSQTEFIQNKVKEITQTASWESRMIVWKMGIETWQERPWLGWGEENFTSGFAKHYEPSLALTNDLWYDRVHNIFIDQLVSKGVVGLTTYFLIFVIAVVSLFGACLKLSDKKDLIVPLGIIALLAVYLVQDMWVFDMVSSYIMFFITLGFIYFLTQEKKEEKAIEETKYKKPYVFVFGLLIVLALTTLYWGNVRPLQASHYIVEAKKVSIGESIDLFNKGIGLSPMALPESSEQFSSYAAGAIFLEGVNRNDLYRAFLESEYRLKEAIEKNPDNFRLYLTLGKHYNNFYSFVNNQELLDLAREALEKAKILSPKNQQVYWELAQNELYMGNKDACIAYMQESIDLEPDYYFSYWFLSLVHRVLGENQLAWNDMQIARDKGFDWNNDLNDLIKVISVNQALGNDEDLIALYGAALKLDPKNAKLAGGMALSYANLGYYEKASEMASLAAKLDPTLKDDLQSIIDLWK